MFGEDEIENLRKHVNSKYKTDIKAGRSEVVWKNIQEVFSSKCKKGKTECIIGHMINRPKAPNSWIHNHTEWLSDYDITKVEHNYEKLFKGYKFLGCVSIDFDLRSETGKCIVDALCSIKLHDLYRKGYTQMGIVINTDVHTGPGEHWVALFCDISPELENPRVTYFDSYARHPEKEIKTLMRRWRDEWLKVGIHSKPMETDYNTTRHQFKDSECGMYCIYFHYCCLNNIPMDVSIPDEVINSFRNVLFNIK